MLWLVASLMMTPVEEAQVAPLLETAPTATRTCTTIEANDNIHLSALVYTSPDEWVVWLNGSKMRPQTLIGDGFHIKNVSASSVTIALTDHPNKAFVLSPGEHLNRANGQIVDALAESGHSSEQAGKNPLAPDVDLFAHTHG